MGPISHCPSCGTSYTEGERFCVRDGTGLRPSAASPGRGRTVGERFVLQEMLGRDSLGVVYRAVHRSPDKRDKSFVVKLLRPQHISGERALLRFLREAKRISALHHPGILDLYDHGCTDDGEPYLVTEYLPGATLEQALSESAPGGGLLLSQVVDIALQVTRALSHAHRHGVVHRDLKPKNILLGEGPGQGDYVRVLDFGIPTMLGLSALSSAGKVLGTAEYLPPEAWMVGVQREPMPAADLYALGILLHEALAGSPPFTGDPGQVLLGHLNQVPPLLSQRCSGRAVPPELDALAAHLLAKEPALRPEGVRAAEVLEQVARGLPQAPSGLPVQHTLILLPDRQQRQTVISGRPAEDTMILQRSHRETPITDKQAATPEGEVVRLSARIAEVAGELADEVWRGGWPTEAIELRSRIADCEQACERQVLQVALLSERLETADALLRKEGGPGTTTGEGREDPLPVRLQAARQHVHELQRDLGSAWGQLAGLLLEAPYPAPQELRAERDCLLELVQQLYGLLRR